jgi:hypothetical protein
MERGLGPLRPEISEHTAYVLGTTRHQIPSPYANFRAPLPVTGLKMDYVRAKKAPVPPISLLRGGEHFALNTAILRKVRIKFR